MCVCVYANFNGCMNISFTFVNESTCMCAFACDHVM